MIEYLTIPHEIMNRKNPLHYALFDYKNNSEMKLFITILAYATMIYRNTKKEADHNFNIKGLLGESSILNRRDLSVSKIISFINELKSPFFHEIKTLGNEIHFKLSKQYKRNVKDSGFNRLEISDLKTISDVRTVKLFILTKIKPSGYFDLHYLFKVLDLNTIKRRDNKIAKIKKSFKSINVEAEYK
ncbi:hypothetical protein, partial [Vibrio minamisatsumaniensis]|uniref:hypothetical protein n=1 Tax=Vibrio minamisatsumaniensis TaxID=2910243 RepID=UPI003D2304A5